MSLWENVRLLILIISLFGLASTGASIPENRAHHVGHAILVVLLLLNKSQRLDPASLNKILQNESSGMAQKQFVGAVLQEGHKRKTS